MASAIPYHHVQPGWLIRIALGIPAAGALIVGVVVRPELLAVAAVLAIALLLFHSLTVEVDSDAIHVAFGIGVIRRSIPLDRVASCRAARTPWYFGWGIRYVFKGWLWNVSGFYSVELTYTDGGHFRIGSDEADALAAAICEAQGLCTVAS